MEEEKLEKKLLEKNVAMKAMTWSVVDLEKTVSCLETEKSLLVKMINELLSC